MKSCIRYLSFIVAIIMFISVPVCIAEAVEERASHYFAAYSVYLWEPTNEAWVEVTAVDTMDELGASEIKIERSTDQENWTTMKTFKKEDYSQMTADNKSTFADCVPYTFTDGYYYRGVVTLYAKKGNGTGTMTVVTPTLDKR